MTDAMIGYDTEYAIFSGGGYVNIGEVFDVTPGESVAEQVDATHYQSPGRRREKIAGLIDSGNASFQINWVPGNATDELLRAFLASGERVNHRITFPNAITVIFTAAVTGYSKAIPIDDRMTATVTVAISGDETWSG